MTKQLPVVDMTEHLTFDDAVTVAMQERFSMPLVVIAALRQAGKKMTMRMLELAEDDEKFEKLNPTEKMKLFELIVDRAYGKTETASASMKLLHQTGQLNPTNANMGRQLDEIEQRMEERAVKYPEMRKLAKGRAVDNPLHNSNATGATDNEANTDADREARIADRINARVVRLHSTTQQAG